MATYKYRYIRNIKKSTKSRIRKILDDNNFSDVGIEFAFTKAYTMSTPCVCLRLRASKSEWVEMGSDLTTRSFLIILDVLTEKPDYIEDIVDLLVSELKAGWDYKEHRRKGGTTTDATIDSTITNGMINVTDIDVDPVNDEVDLSNQEYFNKWQWRISLTCDLSILEE